MKEHAGKVPKWVEEYRRKEEEFWQRTYPAKSWTEKVEHWVEGIEAMMQASQSSGADAYEGFNPQAYAVWVAQEPRIDDILAQLPARIQGFETERMWTGIRAEEG